MIKRVRNYDFIFLEFRLWTKLKVNAIAADQPRILTFLDQNGSEITDNDDDVLVTPPETPHEIPGVIGDVHKSQEWIRMIRMWQ